MFFTNTNTARCNKSYVLRYEVLGGEVAVNQINNKSSRKVIWVFFAQIMINFFIVYDIPIARQVLGFVFLTLIPGFVILKIIKLNEFDHVETLLFSVGLSVAFLMIVGLLTNEFGFLLGILQPLSPILLLVIFNSAIILFVVLLYARSGGLKLSSESICLSPIVPLFLFLPILSIAGGIWLNVYGNNWLLLVIVAISLIFVVSTLLKTSKLYSVAVFLIAVTLLYHSSFVSNYIISFGSDVPVEYFLFKTTENSAHWNSTFSFFWDAGYNRVNAMLSVTILPTIYSVLLKVDATWVFKILFPLIFAFVSLGLYKFWQKYTGKKYAFIAAFLFMAQCTFYTEMLGLNRQMIAELFLVLLLLVIMNKKIKPINRIFFFTVFSFALVISHYGIAEIFLFFIFSVLVFQIILKRPTKNVTVSMAVLFFVIMFAWYIFMSGSAVFKSFVEFGDYVYRQLGDFFNPATRGQTVLTGLGMTESPSIWNTFSRIFAYFTQALIVVGFVGLVAKRAIYSRFGDEFFVFSSIAIAFLAALIVVPGLANTMNMTRFYHVLLFFLSPLCVVGAEFIANLVFKRKHEITTSVLLLIVLLPYFLFQTGFIYEVTGSDSWSIPLSGYRMPALRLYGDLGYMDVYSVYGAQWVSKNIDFTRSRLYSDGFSRNNVLTIYGLIYRGNVDLLSNVTVLVDNGVIYLSRLNVVENVVPSERFLLNHSELTFIFDDLSLVYANGGSIIYKNAS